MKKQEYNGEQREGHRARGCVVLVHQLYIPQGCVIRKITPFYMQISHSNDTVIIKAVLINNCVPA